MRKILAAASAAALLTTVVLVPPAVAAPAEDPSVRFDGRLIHLSSQTMHDYAALLQQQVEELADPGAVIEAHLPDSHGALTVEYIDSLDTDLQVLSVESEAEYGELDTTHIEEALAGEVHDKNPRTGERRSALIFDLPEGRVGFDVRYYLKEEQSRGYKGKFGGKWRALPHLDAHDLDNAFESATVEVTLGRGDTPVATIEHQLTGTTEDLREGHGVRDGVIDDPRIDPAFDVDTTFLPAATTQDRTTTAAINEHLWQVVAHDTGQNLATAAYPYFTPDLPPEPWDPPYPLDDPAQHPLFHTALEQLYTHMFSLGSPHTLLNFSDVDQWHTFYLPVRWMVVEDITQGYADGTFRPRQSITRGETATLLYRYYDPEFTAPNASPFPDLPPDSTHYEAIAWMKSEGLVTGYSDAEFKKDRNVSRGEVANILNRMDADSSFQYDGSSPFKDLTGTSANHYSIYWLHWAGLADGYADGTFRRHAAISRGEFAKMLHQFELKIGK